jgi:hypothetical protein
MNPGTTAGFKFGGEALLITLTKLDNALIGEDFATFTITREAPAMDESRKIALLLDRVKELKSATFVRNGGDHSPAKAAEHLASKVEYAGKKDLTARRFIDNIASQSSLTGEVYTIRMADGTLLPVGDYLRTELDKIEHPKSLEKK